MRTVEELKEERPDLVELFETMSKEQLLEQIYKECLDAINMEDRVQLFMNECTNMSKTTYTPEVIKGLISDKQEIDLENYCMDLVEDYTDEEILEEIRKRAGVLRWY